MSVDFAIHHVQDRPGYLLGQFSGNSSSDLRYAPRETLTSSAFGFGLVIGTHAKSMAEAMPDVSTPTSAADVQQLVGARGFLGRAWPNPSFIYEGARTLEGIISLEIEPWVLQYRHGLAVRELLQQIAYTAAEIAHAPLMSLQCPVQLPPHHYVSPTDVRARSDEWPRSSALAVRFSMALKNVEIRKRIEVAERLAAHCSSKGFGLWVGDARHGYSAGNWFSVVDHDKNLSRSLFEKIADRSGESSVNCALPITFVGPARIGSTHAILKFLAENSETGVLSCSVTALDDLAFINLLVAANGVRPSRLEGFNAAVDRAVERARGAGDGSVAPQDVLPALMPLLLRNEASAAGQQARLELETKAGDYQTFVGPAAQIDANHREPRVPIWISWQIEGAAADVGGPIRCLFAALRRNGLFPAHDGADTPGASSSSPNANIEYLVCRDVGGYVLRGRGKISVLRRSALSLRRPSDLETIEARLCSDLQHTWAAELAQEPFLVRQLSVASREHRMGQRMRSSSG